MIFSTVSFAAPTAIASVETAEEVAVDVETLTETAKEAVVASENNEDVITEAKYGQLIVSLDFSNVPDTYASGISTGANFAALGGYVTTSMPEGFPAGVRLMIPGGTTLTPATVTDEETGEVTDYYGKWVYNAQVAAAGANSVLKPPAQHFLRVHTPIKWLLKLSLSTAKPLPHTKPFHLLITTMTQRM